MTEMFSASRASRLMNCHASADLERAIPGYQPPVEDPDKDNAANRGTEMHRIFALVMELPLSDAKYLAPAMQYVFDIMGKRRFKKLVEQTVEADWLPSRPSTTADLVLYLKDELHVFDLKTGKIPVSAQDNDQLMFYAASYLHLAPAATEVHLHIVQPWAGVVEEQVVPTDDLIVWMIDAQQHDGMISHGDLAFGPGDHCMFCPANPRGRGAKGSAFCPVLMDMYYPSRRIDDDAIIDNLED